MSRNNHKRLVRDTSLRCLMHREIKKFTPIYKQICGCKTFIHCIQLQRTFKSWRRIHTNNKNRYKFVVFPDGNVLHETIRDAVNTMMCPKQSSISLSHWKCVLRQCDNYPKYDVPKYESSCLTVAPKIKFHQYVIFSTCSLHGLIGDGRLIYNLFENEKLNGKIRSRKMLTQRELIIGNFMYTFYLSLLEKYIYHVHYVQILSKTFCRKIRQNAYHSKPGNILSIRDYAERTSTNFNLEIKSENFENGRSLSIEGCMIEVVDQDLNCYVKFHFHFSNDSRQDASTTHTHMVSMLIELRNNNQLK